MSDERFERCPFCGSPCVGLRGAGLWYVSCDKCDAEGPPDDDEDEAVVKWNSRSNIAATSAPAPESGNELEDVETGASEAQTAKTGKEEIDG
jgi:Lar family restriction alleviation protein